MSPVRTALIVTPCKRVAYKGFFILIYFLQVLDYQIETHFLVVVFCTEIPPPNNHPFHRYPIPLRY